MAGQVKLGDFGFAVQLTKKNNKLRDLMGTPGYMAPELVAEKPYDTSVDIWSFGILLLELAEGKLPFEVDEPRDVLERIRAGPPRLQEPKKWSAPFKDFVTKCLVVEPTKRFTASQLLIHEFLTGA
jgi:serine/threonine protein kinase